MKFMRMIRAWRYRPQ